MVFWVGILVGASFAWLAIKNGFYEMWIMLFNTIISIYLAVFLGPIMTNVIPEIGDTLYSNALTMLATAVAAYLILYAISYIFFTSQISVPFPKIFDVLGAGFLGFSAGFLLWSFACLLISITPLSQQPMVKEIDFAGQFQRINIPYLSWWCDRVNMVVSCQNSTTSTEQTISALLEDFERKAHEKATKQAEPNEPAWPDTKTGIPEKYRLSLPPEDGAKDI